jgi:hypothetical protein
LNFLPEPHGHGSFRPTFGVSRVTVWAVTGASDGEPACTSWSLRACAARRASSAARSSAIRSATAGRSDAEELLPRARRRSTSPEELEALRLSTRGILSA